MIHQPLSSLEFCLALVLIVFGTSQIAASSIRVENRHLYSLTTFHADGKLAQVERAVAAATHGVPILASVANNELLLVAPQFLPSPFYIDDGTSRFSRISSSIVVAHTGMSADGRVLVTASKRCSIEHEYTFEEEIGINKFLEEMSLLMQEATMTPGQRPFGSSLVVAYVPRSPGQDAAGDFSSDDDDDPPPAQVYRIDPSGNVQAMGETAVLNGNVDLQSDVDLAVKEKQLDLALLEDTLVGILRKSVTKAASLSSKRETKSRTDEDTGTGLLVRDRSPCVVLTASLSLDGKFSKEKYDIDE